MKVWQVQLRYIEILHAIVLLPNDQPITIEAIREQIKSGDTVPIRVEEPTYILVAADDIGVTL